MQLSREDLKVKPTRRKKNNSISINSDTQKEIVPIEISEVNAEAILDNSTTVTDGKFLTEIKEDDDLIVKEDADVFLDEVQKEGDILIDEISQESGSDIDLEDDIDVSPSKNQKVIVASSSCSKDQSGEIQKENAPFSPPSIIIDKEVLHKIDSNCTVPSTSAEEILHAVENIKKEVPDHLDTIHQLIALKNVANSQEVENDADVICIGESTRLSAQITNEGKTNSDANLYSRDQLNSATSQQTMGNVVSDIQEDVQSESLVLNETKINCKCSYFTKSVERVKKGWTFNTSGKITVGELYLMVSNFNCPLL